MFFYENQPLFVPIYPVTVASQTDVGFHERQQLPHRLAWSLTIQKSHGLTLPKAWKDIGKSERTAGVMAISRAETFASCVIAPVIFERLRGEVHTITEQQAAHDEKSFIFCPVIP